MVSLGGGQRAPYANPSTPAATKMGRSNRRVDSKPEVLLRSQLHGLGLRFRKDHPLRIPGHRPVRADIAFTRVRVLVFLDGCFWHGCPLHGTVPKTNRDYWQPKLRANADRDRLVDRLCQEEGWTVIRVWEHEEPELAGQRVLEAVRPT